MTLNPNYRFTVRDNILKVNKKDLEFSWEYLDLIYDGNPKQIYANVNENEVVNNDNINLSYTIDSLNNQAINAGDYNIALNNNLENYNLIETDNNKFNTSFLEFSLKELYRISEKDKS